MQPIAMPTSPFLPDDLYTGTLVTRIWNPAGIGGPSVAVIREDAVYDLSGHVATMSALLEAEEPVVWVRSWAGYRVGTLEEVLANSTEATRDPGKPYFLSPCDLQVIKAAGVTFATSMIERVIEEKAGGDASRAQDIRAQVVAHIGSDLAAIKPGSAQAMQLKAALQAQGIWSQYLEVGIGPDAEVFTKAPVLSSVGTGSDVGIRSDSHWNNPEPEVVLAVNSRGVIQGACLGNDVNLRDIEGRSALLLGKAKDNNASCALGPFIRLFDESFDLDHVRRQVVQLQVSGEDGFVLLGSSSMDQISRDPLELVQQTLGAHQYPDGFMLFMGTLFAPTQDRDQPGGGFTHHLGDVVRIQSPHLGALCNRVTHCEQAAPWQFGLGAFFANLAKRGLLLNEDI
ncbi:fumarylacetoacetate hydrolase family protein [Rhodoferax sp. GW822-FHT02A01]|uniref:fumarylacetoacetate hydrolase family protein n=1 Tax=Rhodoferax sp. GW822-FHT02A01 TaxID=3141537 RepID=UPI00315C5E6F